MLHKINHSRKNWLYLSWIVRFQHRLLFYLCDSTIQPEEVTVEKVQALFPGLEEKWMHSFCNRKRGSQKDSREPRLVRMQAIAGLSEDDKKLLLAAFEYDTQQLQYAYQEGSQEPFKPRGLTVLQDKDIRENVRWFFESFYSVSFYYNEGNRMQGYYIPRPHETPEHFHHHAFLNYFNEANQTLRVCAFCDGALSGVQIDHFYPKDKQSFLSCHPLNLVPICGECNKAKLAKSPFDMSQEIENPLLDWFHPYLRTLQGEFKIAFTRGGDHILRPSLVGNDDLINKRLHNLEEMLGLKKRWSKALRECIEKTKSRIDGLRCYLLRKEQNNQLSREKLIEKLCEWKWEIPIGEEAFGLILKAYLEQAVEENPDMLDELWVYCNHELDPVTLEYRGEKLSV